MFIELANIGLFFAGILAQTALRIGPLVASRRYRNVLLQTVVIVALASLFIGISGGPLRVLVPAAFLFYLIGMTSFAFFKELTPFCSEEIVVWYTLLFWWLFTAGTFGWMSPIFLFLGVIATIGVIISCVTKIVHPVLTLGLNAWHVFTVMVFGTVGFTFFNLMEAIQPARFALPHFYEMFVGGMTAMFLVPHIFLMEGLLGGFMMIMMHYGLAIFSEEERSRPVPAVAESTFEPVQVTMLQVIRAVVVIGIIVLLNQVAALPPGIVVTIVMVILPNLYRKRPAARHWPLRSR